ncbi:type II toxin-antitoxin system HipA family toxin [Marinobacterium jannaschii]|uniref:type II toxin-antitoxin system HipA family toxin n=1 Tax=Marinobacterium jannaschii TaxID=64970 RepID=UPI00048576A6|nr:type II toxin-antitoxin system HipA family toxin [Marinobacterium jannaschii]
MANMTQHNVARVEMWGQLVGALSHDDRSGLCAFQYAPEWIQGGIEISPVKLPLSNRVYQFPALPRDTYRGLPGAFADTLPDDFGNAVIDAWLARSGRDRETFSSLERLLYTGSRGMGALEYLPSIERPVSAAMPLELDGLVAMAQSVLDQRSGLAESLVEGNGEALSAILQVGTSAGGARPKAVIGINADRTEIRSGQVDLPDGFEHYLLKFDGVVEHSAAKETFGDPQGFGRMEYAYYLMARDAGIDISPCELLQDGERAHFMTRRFDRIGNKKLHYQSLCAMDHADYKQPGHYSYEQLFSLMRSLRFKKAAALELYRRMVFNIVARNHDDHTKNFGFILDRSGQWQLAPAFDIAYSYKPGSKWVNSHQLSLNGKRDDFTREDLLLPAEKFRKDAEQIIDEVIEVVSQWPKYAAEAGVFPAFSTEIAQSHRLYL